MEDASAAGARRRARRAAGSDGGWRRSGRGRSDGAGSSGRGGSGEVVMLQELAVQTGAGVWVIASMIFFVVVWLVIALLVVRVRPEVLDARARLALEGENEDGGVPSGTRADR